MEEPNQTESLSVDAASGSSSSSSQTREDHNQSPDLVQQQQQIDVSYHAIHQPSNNEPLRWMREDTFNCIIAVLTFCFFASTTLVLGIYGTVTLRLGPGCSHLLHPNPLFVESVKVELSDDTIDGPMLYGFYNKPPLDVITNWSDTHFASLRAKKSKDWAYFLNEGSQINISYSVDSPKSPNSSSLILIIAEGASLVLEPLIPSPTLVTPDPGTQGFVQWILDPSYPNTTLSWNIIHGNGLIQQYISKSSSYYIAVGNLNSGVVKVQLNISTRAFLYNTTDAYYKCTLAQGPCSLELFFPSGNDAVLTTPVLRQGTHDDDWHVILSYGPRWITYFLGIAVMTSLMLVSYHFFNNYERARQGGSGVQYGEGGSERDPLLLHKDDDVLSWGSSCDSMSQDGEDPEDGFVSLDGKPLKDGENNNNTRRLCAICFDALRDCFFLPCGHCVACFACGTRIQEAAGTCPICRRKMKKVKKIFTV